VNDCYDLIRDKVGDKKRLWLFLDYDGTLAEFAPTPDHIEPQEEIVELISYLGKLPSIRLAVVSGRRLNHIKQLLPQEEILLAGTYGIELQDRGGELINRVSFDEVRPTIEQLKPRWEDLIADHKGFYLEDKEWSIALHARFASDQDAEQVLAQAREYAEDAAKEAGLRIMGGHKFLEIGPQLANKGLSVAFLLDEYPFEGALPIFIGDDDKDEEAFSVIHEHGGVAIVVSSEPRATIADCRLDSPKDVHAWLRGLPKALNLSRFA